MAKTDFKTRHRELVELVLEKGAAETVTIASLADEYIGRYHGRTSGKSDKDRVRHILNQSEQGKFADDCKYRFVPNGRVGGGDSTIIWKLTDEPATDVPGPKKKPKKPRKPRKPNKPNKAPSSIDQLDTLIDQFSEVVSQNVAMKRLLTDIRRQIDEVIGE